MGSPVRFLVLMHLVRGCLANVLDANEALVSAGQHLLDKICLICCRCW